MKHPLSRFAPSPSLPLREEGDSTLGAGRPFLGAPVWGHASVTGSAMGH